MVERGGVFFYNLTLLGGSQVVTQSWRDAYREECDGQYTCHIAELEGSNKW